MSIYRQQIERAIQATDFRTPGGYLWVGEPDVLPLSVPPQPGALVQALKQRLYASFFTQGGVAVSRQVTDAPVLPGAQTAAFLAALSAANVGPGRREFINASPGFYSALGAGDLTMQNSTELVRIYFDLTPEGAPVFIRLATSTLNKAGLPFQLKVLLAPELYRRCDAGVLYFPKSVFPEIAAFLKGAYPEIAPYLRSQIPAFTRPLAPGIGLAEDPGIPGQSFGQHRCLLLAEALVRVAEAGMPAGHGRTPLVLAALERSGLNLNAPYLRGNGPDDYALSLSAAVARHEQPPSAHARPEQYLRTAAGLGARLAEKAIWHADRCNWLGPVIEETHRQYASLDPTLYGGSSGIGLFLAELGTITADEDLRRAAHGAIRQSLKRCDAPGGSLMAGLYNGRLGICLAAVRAGMLLGDDDLIAQARRTLAVSRTELPVQAEYDLVSGQAGGIVGLLRLRDWLQDDSLLDVAVRCGNWLVSTARPAAAGCCWGAGYDPKVSLTGFSHGTAGVAQALLELFRVTGDQKYREVAEEAFAYERYWFDETQQNWPDFRPDGPPPANDKRPRMCSMAWCHGAPGIALSRLRAFEITGDATYKAEALVALETTRRSLEASLAADNFNFSLCHGFAGNAEILAEGARILGRDANGLSDLVGQIAAYGIDKYGSGQTPWLCGFGTEEMPGLMMGLAGIGLFYLRLAHPEVPSVLLLSTSAPVSSSVARA